MQRKALSAAHGAKRVWGGAVVLLAGSALTLCGCSDSHVEGDSRGAGPTPSAATSAPVTAAEYGTSLSGATAPVDNALAELARARSGVAVQKALRHASDATGGAGRRLDGVRTPEPVRSEHAALARAMDDLHTDLLATSTALAKPASSGLCTPRAAVAQVGTEKSFAALRTAGATLTARGYKVGLVLPRMPRQQHRSLGNGTFLRDGDRSGRGVLTVVNSGGSDTTLTVARGKKVTFTVYARKHSTVKVRHIDDGTYTIYYASGEDWDQGAKKFSRNCSFQKFDRTSKFETTTTSTQIVYSTWTLTLKPGPGGNATVSDVPPGQYPSY
ncbi:hypothetical protein [Streptomyces beijiangensis]|uniref:Lipoprotein n=1 Tax=Streptomyces beijiangensis TaxID=163361 RepID=A0A939JDX5_9ACTN|nr:hypothetical protein [Streptomyces beijiangensis]MBO0510738.1 hypothetical protein [Streptomyces beijiangensis]